MADKIGSEIARDFFDRGRRELGGFFFPDSNIAQPTYPSRGGINVGKEIEAPTGGEREDSVLDKHLEQASQSRDDRGPDDPNRGIDRE
jgi:hypothetical protein